MLSAIVAATDNNVISKNNKIPWKMPADVAFLRQKIKGHALIMGSATYSSMGKAYPGCTNIVLSRHLEELPDATVVRTVDEALKLDEVKKDNEPFIFGGETIYKLAMPFIQRIYLTRIHTPIAGDWFFNYNPNDWKEVSKEEHKKDAVNPYDYTFIILERRT
jgi:dihydrofolate reductase